MAYRCGHAPVPKPVEASQGTSSVRGQVEPRHRVELDLPKTPKRSSFGSANALPKSVPLELTTLETAEQLSKLSQELNSLLVSELHTFSNNESLLEDVFAGREFLRQEDLAIRLGIDDRIRRSDTPGLLAEKSPLSGEEAKLIRFLHHNWDHLAADTISRTSLADVVRPEVSQAIEVLRPPNEKLEAQVQRQTLDINTLEHTRSVIGNTLEEFRSANGLRLVDATSSAMQVSVQPSSNEPRNQPQIRTKSESSVRHEEFRFIAVDVFQRIDKDGDGFLSKAELAKAVQDANFTGKEAQVIAAMYKHADRIDNMHNDEFGPENNGITIEDLLAFEYEGREIVKDYTRGDESLRYLKENFSKLDQDGNGYASREELVEALRSAKTDEERLKLAYLIGNIDDLQKSHNDEFGRENDGITLADADSFDLRKGNEVRDAVLDSISIARRTRESQREGTCISLYANPDDPLRDISSSGICQGTIGDCYFLSALASLADERPELIRDMIVDNGDGTYTVTFPGDPANPITVKAPTEAEMGLYNAGNPSGTWALVLEKAAGKYRQQVEHSKRGLTPQEGLDGGGRMEWALKLLTGEEPDSHSLASAKRDLLRRSLNEALNGDRPEPVTANTEIPGVIERLFGGSGTTKDGFAKQHAYSIIGFDPSGPGGGTITIRNPWGGPDGTTYGTIRISLDEFLENFEDIQFG